jgi:hypothetical protein
MTRTVHRHRGHRNRIPSGSGRAGAGSRRRGGPDISDRGSGGGDYGEREDKGYESRRA